VQSSLASADSSKLIFALRATSEIDLEVSFHSATSLASPHKILVDIGPLPLPSNLSTISTLMILVTL
jgi:hypothetical protein